MAPWSCVVDRPAGHAALHRRAAGSGRDGGDRDVVLGLDVLEVADRDVVGVQTEEAWRRRDWAGSALPPAAPPGIADRDASGCSASERRISESPRRRRRSPSSRRTAGDHYYIAAIAGSMVDDRPIDDMVPTGATERDRGLDLARRATDALVAASGGGAMSSIIPHSG